MFVFCSNPNSGGQIITLQQTVPAAALHNACHVHVSSYGVRMAFFVRKGQQTTSKAIEHDLSIISTLRIRPNTAH